MSSSFFDLNNFKLSRASRDCRKAKKRIQRLDEPSLITCNYYFNENKPYVKMTLNYDKLIYAECRKRDRFYVLIL